MERQRALSVSRASCQRMMHIRSPLMSKGWSYAFWIGMMLGNCSEHSWGCKVSCGDPGTSILFFSLFYSYFLLETSVLFLPSTLVRHKIFQRGESSTSSQTVSADWNLFPWNWLCVRWSALWFCIQFRNKTSSEIGLAVKSSFADVHPLY